MHPCRLKSIYCSTAHIQEHLHWDVESALAGGVSSHTGLITPADVVCMFTAAQEGKSSYFPKCLLLVSAGESSRLWRECAATCQSKPTETWWVSHCHGSGDQLAVHWNSSDIGTGLTAQVWVFSQSGYLSLYLTHIKLNVALINFQNKLLTLLSSWW